MLGGGIVLSDRSVTTSLAYQAFGRELGIAKVWEANRSAVNGIFPDLVIYMNVGRETCFKRSGGDEPDKFDSEDEKFWNRTILGYDKMLEFMKEISPETQIIRINDPKGEYSIEETRLIIKSELYPILNNHLHEGRIIRDRQV